jgi:maleate cis-trans isomerase
MTEVRCNQYAGGRRVGIIVPSVNATIEPELAWLAIPEVSFHATRVMLRETTPEGVRAMNMQLVDAARLIGSVGPEVVAYACTSGSFLDGPRALQEQIALIGNIVACPVVATSSAMVEAMRSLSLRRVALATPYLDSINEAEQRFLEAHGIEVVAVRGLGLSGSAIREVTPARVVELARATDTSEAQALFISCTDLRALETVEYLEAALGKPVLTSNQVTVWAVLRALRRPTVVPGFGGLLSR